LKKKQKEIKEINELCYLVFLAFFFYNSNFITTSELIKCAAMIPQSGNPVNIYTKYSKFILSVISVNVFLSSEKEKNN
jgi:hypothetical protein